MRDQVLGHYTLPPMGRGLPPSVSEPVESWRQNINGAGAKLEAAPASRKRPSSAANVAQALVRAYQVGRPLSDGLVLSVPAKRPCCLSLVDLPEVPGLLVPDYAALQLVRVSHYSHGVFSEDVVIGEYNIYKNRRRPSFL